MVCIHSDFFVFVHPYHFDSCSTAWIVWRSWGQGQDLNHVMFTSTYMFVFILPHKCLSWSHLWPWVLYPHLPVLQYCSRFHHPRLTVAIHSLPFLFICVHFHVYSCFPMLTALTERLYLRAQSIVYTGLPACPCLHLPCKHNTCTMHQLHQHAICHLQSHRCQHW